MKDTWHRSCNAPVGMETCSTNTTASPTGDLISSAAPAWNRGRWSGNRRRGRLARLHPARRLLYTLDWNFILP